MKKIVSVVLLLVMLVLPLVSCTENNSGEKLLVGYMMGPTGMGFAKLVHDNGGKDGNDKYAFENYQNNTQNAIADLAVGNVDIVSVPTNLAANYYNQNKNIVVLGVNCLNSLYVVSDKNNTIEKIEDLNGKTVYTCSSGTPKPVLEFILSSLGINATVSTTFDNSTISEPKDVGALVTAGKLPIAVLPEPMVTSSLLAIQKAGNSDVEYSIDIDLGDCWDTLFDTPVTMGCIVARADFVEKNKDKIDTFLAEYKASIEYVSNKDNLSSASDYIVDSGIIAAKGAATKSLSNLGDSISFIGGEEMESALKSFYGAIGITAPDSMFYYVSED